MSVRQLNLARLLSGGGRYLDDLTLPGLVHAAVVRSPVAHGDLVSFETSRALKVDGVVDVVTPADAVAALRPVVGLWRSPGLAGTTHVVGDPHLTFVGQPLGLVVATDVARAWDGLDELDLGIEERTAVLDLEAALDPGGPLVHDEWGTNLAGELGSGDDAAACAEVFATAPVVIEQQSRFPPVVPHPLETRGIVADWDPATERLTVWLSTQAPHDARDQLAAILGLRTSQVHVVVPDVGGAFGAKVHVYDDEVLVCLAALRLGRPVKWVEGREEHQVATDRGRDALHTARLALDEDGRFLALESRVRGNLGAHASSAGIGPFFVSVSMLQGPYRFDRVGGRVEAVVTNTTPTGSYRGFGNTESALVRERLIDRAAAHLGIDPVELRLRNLVRPEEMPFQTRGHARYDSGDYPAALRMLRDRAATAAPAAPDGRRRGVGVAFGVEYTGLGPARDLQWINFGVSGHETARVEMHADGTVSVASALVEMGQGIATSFAQIAAEVLGTDPAAVAVTLGDTRVTPYSSAGSMTSRSLTVGGPAVREAAEGVRDRLLRLAAHRLDVPVADLVLRDDEVRPVSGGEAVPVAALAEALWLGWDLPDGLVPGLSVVATYRPEAIAFSYAAHAAAVAVDPATGATEVEAYWVVHDCGTVVNEAIVEGQIRGGIAQGIGNALWEQVGHDGAGRPTLPFGPASLPRAADVPEIVVDHLAHPSPVTPGGMKGVGEGGTIVSVAAVANAVAAALPEVADRVVSVPLTPERVWTLLQDARAPGEPVSRS